MPEVMNYEKGLRRKNGMLAPRLGHGDQASFLPLRLVEGIDTASPPFLQLYLVPTAIRTI